MTVMSMLNFGWRRRCTKKSPQLLESPLFYSFQTVPEAVEVGKNPKWTNSMGQRLRFSRNYFFTYISNVHSHSVHTKACLPVAQPQKEKAFVLIGIHRTRNLYFRFTWAASSSQLPSPLTWPIECRDFGKSWLTAIFSPAC